MDLKLEQLSIHSRDLACRYVVVKAGETLSYSIKPQRNSIFYGLYKQSEGVIASLTQHRTPGKSSALPQASTNFEERIRQAKLEPVAERKKLPGGKVFKASFAVEHEGMYCLVFDNTFSKQKSKLVTFILQIHSSAITKSVKTDSLVDDDEAVPQVAEEHLSGLLLKKRRKKMQGWAKRFFVLDFESNTLNYYLSESSSVLRGAIPLKVAVFSANPQTFEINIDSGAEVWNLRARSEGSFALWKNSLAQARDTDPKSSDFRNPNPEIILPGEDHNGERRAENHQQIQNNLWNRLETVLSDMNEVRESLRDIVITESILPDGSNEERRSQLSPTRLKPIDLVKVETTGSGSPKKSFWGKRRPSELSATTSGDEVLTHVKSDTSRREGLLGLESHLSRALQDFSSIMRERKLMGGFSNFVPIDKRSGRALLQASSHRMSMDSTTSADEVWSDALSGDEDFGFLLAHTDPDVPQSCGASDEDDSSDDESTTGPDLIRRASPSTSLTEKIFSESLYPLTFLKNRSIRRRSTIPPIVDQPPSVLKLMTSKVGSEVSSLSAPAATNEPLTLLQRIAEDLEYSELLDAACEASAEDGSRIFQIAAFALSAFASARHKERAKRKPFNPMLGETYELIREDKKYRFIAEKVQHRPLVGVAAHAESQNWTFSQYQATSQKFYGKSMLLMTEGSTTIRLNTKAQDVYVWEKPEVYLKNITWGEKFLEPCGEMVVRNIVNGQVAIVKFVPSKSTWVSTRSEDVTIEAFDADGRKFKNSLMGSWARHLTLGSEEIWHVSSLVGEPDLHCGFPTFAAQLNEITEIEKDNLPPTDSRLRPDLRHRETGHLSEAEHWKVKIEESQRRRRAEQEESGQVHQPQFFSLSCNEKTWEPRSGEHNYWRAREKAFEGLDLVELFR